MKRKIKSIISLLLIIVLSLSYTTAFSAWDGYIEEESIDGRTTIVDMDSYQTISASGAGATIEHTKSSQYAAWWTPKTTRNVDFKENIPQDWSGYKSIQFWMYSPAVKNTMVILLVYCKSGDGYFSKTINVDWEGWKLFDLSLLDDLGQSRGGKLDNIGYIRFTSNGWGAYVEDGTELGIDDIMLKKPAKGLVGTMEDRYGEEKSNSYLEYAKDRVAIYDNTTTVLKGGVTERHDKENAGARTKVVNSNTVIPFEFFDNYLGTTTVKSGDLYTIKKDSKSVSFTKDKEEIKLNGNTAKADVVPFEEDGKLYVPVKQICDALSIPYEKYGFLSVFNDGTGSLVNNGLDEIMAYGSSYYDFTKDNVTECDFKKIEKNWREYYVGNENNDLNDPAVKKRVDEIGRYGYDLMTTMNRNPKVRNLWGTQDIAITNSMTLLYGKIYSMALAYGTYGSKLYKNEELLDAICYALDWGDRNLYGENERKGKGWRDTNEYNWWDWRIGTARNLVNTLIIMHEDIPTELYERCAISPSYFGQAASGTGTNRIDGCYIQIGCGILNRDAERIKRGRDSVDEVIWYSDFEDGMHEDGSYIYHSKHPMNGAYGVGLVEAASNIISILNDTKFETTGLLSRYVAEWFAKAYEPFYYNGSMMSMVFGRGTLSNDKSVAANVMKAYLRMLDIFDEEERPLVEAFMKEQILKNDLFYSSDLTINELNIVAKIMNDDSIKPRSDYFMNKVYYNMDRFVQHSPKYSAGVAMSSSRIWNYESINNQNSKGWYIGDGMLYVYTKGKTSFDPIFWTTSDPYKRPGTTVDTQPRVVAQVLDAYLSDEDFVGGVSDGDHGMAAMKLDTYCKTELTGIESTGSGVENPLHNSTLEAQKAWFTFDDEIVALGAGVNAEDGFPVRTILDNRQAVNSQSAVAGATGAYKIMSVSASHEPQTDNPGAHAVDDSYDTRWSAEGEVYIDLDLGEVKPVGYVGIAIYGGKSRKQNFDAQVSTDGKNWTTVYEGQSSGTTADLEVYDVKDADARYVRILGHEADVSTWNSFTEIKVYPQVATVDILEVGNSDYTTTDTIKVDGANVTFNPDETKQFSGMKTFWTENMGGWYFPTPQTMSVKATNTSRVFIESWLEHGVSPTNEGYAYVQLPDYTEAETAEYAQNPEVEILSNTDALQAVREKTLGKTGFVFWKKGSIENISVSAPLLVMTEENDKEIILSISDPTQKLISATIDVTIPGLTLAESDEEATVTTDENGAKIKLALEGSTGRTYTVKLMKK